MRDHAAVSPPEVPAWRDRVVWRWALLALLLAGMAAAVFRQPLADWLWPDTRIQQLLDRGQAALEAGRLSADDGTGARQLYEAALALDGDRGQARQGLALTGQAALARARAELAAGQYAHAAELLQLARELQVPQAQVAEIDAQLRQRQARHAGAGVDELLRRAAQAHAEGRLDGTPDSALPLYQQVLGYAPERTAALEGREDALSDLLQQARQALARGRLAEASDIIERARGYDAGHYDLPALQAALNAAIDQLRRRADADLRRQRLARAGEGYREILAAVPTDVQARQGLERTVAAYAAQATRSAADFRFADAERSLAAAAALQADSPVLADARQNVEKSRRVSQAMESHLSPAARERRLRQLLADLDAAGARGNWLTPPGASAYDALRAAQALAPGDARVRRAGARIVPETERCFERELRGNRVRAAGACLDAWHSLAPQSPGLGAARRRLAQRWVAVGTERLGAGDAAFARQAAREARTLDPALPELPEFETRLRKVAQP